MVEHVECTCTVTEMLAYHSTHIVMYSHGIRKESHKHVLLKFVLSIRRVQLHNCSSGVTIIQYSIFVLAYKSYIIYFCFVFTNRLF